MNVAMVENCSNICLPSQSSREILEDAFRDYRNLHVCWEKALYLLADVYFRLQDESYYLHPQTDCQRKKNADTISAYRELSSGFKGDFDLIRGSFFPMVQNGDSFFTTSYPLFASQRLKIKGVDIEGPTLPQIYSQLGERDHVEFFLKGGTVFDLMKPLNNSVAPLPIGNPLVSESIISPITTYNVLLRQDNVSFKCEFVSNVSYHTDFGQWGVLDGGCSYNDPSSLSLGVYQCQSDGVFPPFSWSTPICDSYTPVFPNVFNRTFDSFTLLKPARENFFNSDSQPVGVLSSLAPFVLVCGASMVMLCLSARFSKIISRRARFSRIIGDPY